MGKGKNRKKHMDNKRDLLKEIRHAKMNNEETMASAFHAYEMLGLLTLYEDLGCRKVRINKFRSGLNRRMAEYNAGVLSYRDIVVKLAEYGIMIENVHFVVKKDEEGENGNE